MVAEVLKIEEGSVWQLHMNPLMGRKRVVNVCEHLRMKSFLYTWGSQCLFQFSILGNLLISQHGHLDNSRILVRFCSHLNYVLLHHIQHKQLFLYMNSWCPNFWHWKHLWGLGMYGRVSFFRYPILILFGTVCPLMVKTYRLYRMDILLTAMIPCGWSSFLISSSSILSSSSHLMTNFVELRVLCGETFTGR